MVLRGGPLVRACLALLARILEEESAVFRKGPGISQGLGWPLQAASPAGLPPELGLSTWPSPPALLSCQIHRQCQKHQWPAQPASLLHPGAWSQGLHRNPWAQLSMYREGHRGSEGCRTGRGSPKEMVREARFQWGLLTPRPALLPRLVRSELCPQPSDSWKSHPLLSHN